MMLFSIEMKRGRDLRGFVLVKTGAEILYKDY
jgi:hypothetical protein